MSKIVKITITIVVLFIANLTTAQNFENFEKLIVNNWTIEKYELDGQIFPSMRENENDFIGFTADHMSKSINSDGTDIWSWKFDETSGVFTLTNKGSIEVVFSVVSISEDKCILKIESPTDGEITMHLKVFKK